MKDETRRFIQKNQEKLLGILDNNVFKRHFGAYSLESYSERVIEIVKMIPSVLDRYREISDDVGTRFNNILSALYSQLDLAYGLTDAQFLEQHVAIVSEIDKIFGAYFDIKIYLQTMPTTESLKKWLDEVTEKTSKAREEVNEFMNKIEEVRPEKIAIIQRAIFLSSAEESRKSSNWWLGAIVISTIILLVVIYQLSHNFCFNLQCFNTGALVSYNSVCEDCGRGVLYVEIFKSLSYKILIVSIFVLIVKFCIKNYNNCKHNETINKHKQNSFEAAISFIQHTESGKDEIFKLAAQAVFSQQKTGYIAKEGEVLTPSIIDKITSKL